MLFEAIYKVNSHLSRMISTKKTPALTGVPYRYTFLFFVKCGVKCSTINNSFLIFYEIDWDVF